MEVIRQTGKASASLLQRRLKLGYARAARILDILEEKGIIGPPDGAKPREVFLDQLGGVGAMEFSAREHDLEGELRPLDEEEPEPSFTAFTRSQDETAAESEIEDKEEMDEVNEEEEVPETEQKHKNTKAQKQENNLEGDENSEEEEGQDQDIDIDSEETEEEADTGAVAEVEIIEAEETAEETNAEGEVNEDEEEGEEREEELEESQPQKKSNTPQKSGKSYFGDNEWT